MAEIYLLNEHEAEIRALWKAMTWVTTNLSNEMIIIEGDANLLNSCPIISHFWIP